MNNIEAKLHFSNIFKELIKTKPINKITVVELVELSGLSRQTFYKYFKDLDDLIYYIHTDNIYISHKLNEKLSKDDYLLTLYFDLMMENQEFYKHVISSDIDNSFMRLYISKTKENLLRLMFTDYNDTILNDVNLNFALDYYSYGFAHMIMKWIISEKPSPSIQLFELLIYNVPNNLKQYSRYNL